MMMMMMMTSLRYYCDSYMLHKDTLLCISATINKVYFTHLDILFVLILTKQLQDDVNFFLDDSV